jgi:hypothetical protein
MGESGARDVNAAEFDGLGCDSNPGSKVPSVGRAEGHDWRRMLVASAWHKEPPLVDETVHIGWAKKGWHSWNNMSPELEFCVFASDLVRLVEPSIVIETGTGQGFVTRRLVECLSQEQHLMCFEADPLWRRALTSLPFFEDPRCELSTNESPSHDELANADLCVLDSDFVVRSKELTLWWRWARAGSILLVHDVRSRPPWTPHAKLASLIDELRIPGVFLKNPRGGFLGTKPPP